jgi:hypothetical protein
MRDWLTAFTELKTRYKLLIVAVALGVIGAAAGAPGYEPPAP